jgi:hypothetical protein
MTPITSEPGVYELDADEGRELFDRKCRETMDISGGEFLRRLDAGKLDFTDNRVIYLEMLTPFARPNSQ